MTKKRGKNKQHKQQKQQAVRNFNLFKGRYSDKELSVIRNTFSSQNEHLIMAIHKFLLQGNMSEDEMTMIRSMPSEAVDVLRKTILPEIDPETSLGQAVDLWISIETTDKDVEEVNNCMKARQIVIDYFNERIDWMKGEKTNKDDYVVLKDLIFNKMKGKEEAVIEMSARNTILVHINTHLIQIVILADQTPETQEEIEKRRAMDSNK